MQDYQNKRCSECGEEFKENDDVAVCPDCGTPIHRSCWKGRCPNEQKHAEGYNWSETENAGGNSFKNKTIDKSVCGICGEKIGRDTVYCPDCGTPMHIGCYMKEGRCPNTDNHGDFENENDSCNENYSGEPRVFVDTFDSFAEKIMKKPIKNSETGEALTCHGVTQTELLYFLGRYHLSTPRYIGLFLKMANTGKKAAFNFWAGLLMPYYQFYQKMVGPATLMLFASFILGIPQLIYQFQYMTGGVNGGDIAITSEFAGLLNTLSFISLALQIGLAFFSDYIYMNWTVSKIKALREDYKNASEAEYYEALERKGNPKWFFVLLGFGLTMLLTYAFTVAMYG